MGQNDIDLSFCICVHLIKDQQLSNNAQVVLLQKVRTALETIDTEGNEGGTPSS